LTLYKQWFWDTFYGSCWQFNSGFNINGDPVPNLYSNQVGQVNALNLVLHMPYIESDYSFKDQYGAHLYVHNKTTVPFFVDGIDVSVNQDTSIVVNRQFSSTLSAPFSSCVLEPTSFGSVFTDMYASKNLTYTQEECYK
jgi:hypothetical protein